MAKGTKETMYKKILKNNRWSNRPTENTSLRLVNPDDMVNMIHRYVDNYLWENIEMYLSVGLFTGTQITRINLDYGSYIQLERLDTKCGNGGYIIRLYIGKGVGKNFVDTCFALIIDRATVIGLIQSIRNPEFFTDWKKKLAAVDFGYENFELHQSQPTLGVAFI